MAEETKIGWTRNENGRPGHTHNGWKGCEEKTLPDGTPHPGCINCYAEYGYGTRYGVKWGPPYLGGTREPNGETTWAKLLTLARAAAADGEVDRIFGFSLGDVLEEILVPPSILWEKWPAEFSEDERAKMIVHAGKTQEVVERERYRLWDFIRVTALMCSGCGGARWHGARKSADRIGVKFCEAQRPKCREAKTGGLLWLLLTKRPDRWHIVPEDVRVFCALGASVSDQPSANVMLPQVLESTGFAAVFVSAEPLTGAIDMRPWLMDGACPDCQGRGVKGFGLGVKRCPRRCFNSWRKGYEAQIGWVIIGGESGRGDKPRHFRIWEAADLARQVADAGLPVWVKQMGNFPVMRAQAWKEMNPTPMLHAKNGLRLGKDSELVALAFTGKGEDPKEWAHLFGLPADKLQQVALMPRRFQ